MSKAKIKKIILILFVVIFVFSGYQLFRETQQYQQAENEYESLEATYVQKEITQADLPENTNVVTAVEESPYPKLNIDFLTLK